MKDQKNIQVFYKKDFLYELDNSIYKDVENDDLKIYFYCPELSVDTK